jgi:GGDEF domain-containing protein
VDARARQVEETPSRGPVFEAKLRWRAGQILLGLTILLALVFVVRPLHPYAPLASRVAAALGLAGGVSTAAFLVSLRGRRRPEQLALYLLLLLAGDGLAQAMTPDGFVAWPLMAVLVATLAVEEKLPVSFAVAALGSALIFVDAWRGFVPHVAAVAFGVGLPALAWAVGGPLSRQRRRLDSALSELARLKHGIAQFDDVEAEVLVPESGAVRHTLKQVSEEGRRARQLDRAAELEQSLATLVHLARRALQAHSVAYLEIDRGREVALVRVADGPPELDRGCLVPLIQDPIAFVLDRKQSFYATDFKRLLWSLPWYRTEVRVGSLLAVPVRSGDAILGLIVADALEVQALSGSDPDLLSEFATLAADEISRARTALGREELGAEFKAAYEVSRRMAALVEPRAVRQRLLQSVLGLCAVEGGAVVMTDDALTRYRLEEAYGWAAPFEREEVGLSERTWAAWVLRSAEEAVIVDSVAEDERRMPFLVLHEDTPREAAGSLLALPLRARNRTLGALLVTGRQGAFDTVATRVLAILANQAAATLSVIHLKERHKEQAARDGLTGLFNRRAFNDLLKQAIGREERREGRFSLVLLDIDHFKKLNDTFGHPAGDAVLRHTADLLARHTRLGDPAARYGGEVPQRPEGRAASEAARYGGEEFAVVLVDTAEEEARRTTERIREAVAKTPVFFEGARITVSASFGIACWPADGKEPDALISAADRALYSAKEKGRNRVELASTLAKSETDSEAT